MTGRAYVEVVYQDGDRSSGDAITYHPEIIIGRRRFVPDITDGNSPMTRGKANALAKIIASRLGIEVKLTEE